MRRKNLIEARKSVGLTQQDIADQAGIDRAFYSRIESGKRTPSLGVAKKIASVLGMSVDALFLDSDESKRHNGQAVALG